MYKNTRENVTKILQAISSDVFKLRNQSCLFGHVVCLGYLFQCYILNSGKMQLHRMCQFSVQTDSLPFIFTKSVHIFSFVRNLAQGIVVKVS